MIMSSLCDGRNICQVKKGKEELSSAERKQEFQAFMEFESMKNEYYQEQDSNSSDSDAPVPSPFP